MGILICVCDLADKMRCESCTRNGKVIPDIIIRHPRWPWKMHPDARTLTKKNK